MQAKEIMKPTKGMKTRVTVNEGESIENAAILIRDNKMREISVVDDNERVVGVITRNALIEASDDLNDSFFLD